MFKHVSMDRFRLMTLVGILALVWPAHYLPSLATAAEATAEAPAAEDAAPATESTRTKVRVAHFLLKDQLPETTSQLGLFGDMMTDLREMIDSIDKAASDKTISAAIIELRNPAIGRGKIAEIRAAIARFRASGKKIYAQIETGMTKDYMIACACDEIIMPETGFLILPGVRAQGMFYKGLLSKLGIEADFLHMGAYKGAAEPLMRKKFSEPVRENMNALVDSLYDQLVTTIVKNRPLTVAQVKTIIDKGLLMANEAKELDLIDRVAYSDTVRADLAESLEAEPLVYVMNYGQEGIDTDFSGPMGFMKLMQMMMGDTSSRRYRGDKIAVIYATGPIMTGKSKQDPFGGESVGSATIVEALRTANDDKQVKAIVLRINSPGGSAVASDLIWHEMGTIDKPIVASMGDVAASGGYYIAMGADKIIAAPGTITGSIGVVSGKLAIRGMFDKIGVTTDVIERGENSGLFSSVDPFTKTEKEVLTKMMEDFYAQFTAKAAEGRGMPLEKLQELAGGRIYTGIQAQEIGLIDELGTLNDAIAAAKELAGLAPDAKVRIDVLPEATDFFETLMGDAQSEKEVSLTHSLDIFAPELSGAAQKAHQLMMIFREPVALLMPFDLEIE